MNIYDYESYQIGCSNLMMLKIFHDKGIDISNFPNPIVHVGYDSSVSYDILTQGLSELNTEIEMYDYEDIENSPYQEYKGVEHLFVIKDRLIQTVLNSTYCTGLESCINSQDSTIETMDVDIKVLPDKSGYAIELNFIGHTHELLLAIMEVQQHAEILFKKLNEQTKECQHGVSNQLLNKQPA